MAKFTKNKIKERWAWLKMEIPCLINCIAHQEKWFLGKIFNRHILERAMANDIEPLCFRVYNNFNKVGTQLGSPQENSRS